ncbi:hypothetical protein DB346_21060 [Verrucomicrobia bacterium LW23]|nr:hypothetical protein DB346_21060 [Verrucomicrobia bacterium LW23]
MTPNTHGGSPAPAPTARPGPAPAGAPGVAEAEGIHILRIEARMVRIARMRADVMVRLRELLIFLTELTNAHSSFIINPSAPEDVRLIGRVWKDAAPPPSGSVAEMVKHLAPAAPVPVVSLSGDGAGTSAVSQPVVGEPLAAVREMKSMPGHYLVASPVTRGDGQPPYFICLLLEAARPSQLESFLIILQTSTGYVHSILADAGPAKATGDTALKQAAALVELGSLAARADGLDLALRVLADRLRTHLGCALVSIGMARSRRKVAVRAVSGSGNFDRLGFSASLLQGAMRESLSRGEMVVRHAGAVDNVDTDGLSVVAHQEILRALDWATVVSLPLYVRPYEPFADAPADGARDGADPDEGEPLAVVVLSWDKPKAFSDNTRQFLTAARPHLESQIILLKKADPIAPIRWIGRAWDAMGRLWQVALIALLIGAGVLLSMPFPHYMWVTCRVQPELKRVVAAPFEGRLKEAKVEPGDLVKSGDVLAVMDDKELRWKEAQSIAQRDRALTQRDKNLADREAPQATVKMAGLEAEQYAVELETTRHMIAQLELISPIAGVVLTGDLKRAEGIPVKKGDVLFEVAPLDRLVLELDIPDGDLPYVADKPIPLTARLDAFPGDSWRSTVHKIKPQSDVREGDHVFVAEAGLTAKENPDTSKLRPGMKGWAVLEGAPQPLWWQLTHKVWDYLRLTFFW